MLDKIKAFFETHLAPEGASAADDPEHALRLAVAALLLEMSRMDEQVTAEEREAVERVVGEQFNLTAEEIATLLALAEAEREGATDYFQFTSLINQHFDATAKERMVESLWRIAFADGRLDRYEEHLVRRLSDLLYVPHAAFIAAKHRAAS